MPARIGALHSHVVTVTDTHLVHGADAVATGARTGRERDRHLLPRRITVRVERSDGYPWTVRHVSISGAHRLADGSEQPAPVSAEFDQAALAERAAPPWAADHAQALRDQLQNQHDEELLTRRQAVELLQSLGRPVTDRTLRNYAANPDVAPHGWPGIEKHVGRTPMYSAARLTTYARDTKPAKAGP